MLENNSKKKHNCSLIVQRGIKQGDILCDNCLILMGGFVQGNNMSEDEFFRKLEKEEGVCGGCLLVTRFNEEKTYEEIVVEVVDFWDKKVSGKEEWSIYFGIQFDTRERWEETKKLIGCSKCLNYVKKQRELFLEEDEKVKNEV